MQDILRVARLYFVLLGVVTVGRWLVGVLGIPYDRGHHYFSIVILTVFSAIYYGAFLRRWRGYRLMQAIGLGFTLGLASQVVILLATALSYALDMQTYFNNPRALNSPENLAFGQAMVMRLGGTVGNSILAGIVGAFGWALGALLPEK
jgi:hypothetical protein